jgi:hypothetical protein
MTALNPCAPTGVCHRTPARTPAAKNNAPAVVIHVRIA